MTEEIIKEDFNEEEAFEDAVAGLMTEDDTPKEDTEPEEEVEENTDPSEESEEEEDGADTDIEEEEGSAAVDYEALYNQVTAHNATLQQNLDQVESQFKSWQGRIEAEQQRQKEQQDADDKAKTKAEFKVTEDLEDLVELYPSLVPQVQALIDSRVAEEVSGVEDRVAQLVDKQVSPVATRIQETELQAHEAAIKNAHPDIHDVVANGSFRKWVETLAPYQQAGARLVCETGSAEEVIKLFDDFKAATTDKDAASPDNKKSPTKKAAGSKTVDKLKNAMSVPSEMTKPNLDKEADAGDLNKIFAQAEKAVLDMNKPL